MPTIGFDTSGINALVDDGKNSEPLMKALRCAFDVQLPALSVEEVLSTPAIKEPRRELLLMCCQRLLASGQCLWPPHEILRLLITAHSSNPSQFEWTRTDVRARVYEDAIIRRDFPDQLCRTQRKHQFEAEEGFDQMWKGLRPKLDAILAEDPSKRPANYREAVGIAKLEGGVLWGTGRGLYRYVVGSEPTETDIETFMEDCPPFRAACYGLIMGWFDGALRVQDRQPSAGRNDLLMAVYLPYCDRFVTHDWQQEKSLREIAAEARISCDVVSYKNFSGGFSTLLT